MSQSTVLNWLRSGKLAGTRGDQPERPRWSVVVNEAGDPVDAGGHVVITHAPADIRELTSEVQRLRADVANGSSSRSPSTLREVALGLRSSSERQQRALLLQAEAIQELSEALREQGEAISQLLLPDTVEELR